MREESARTSISAADALAIENLLTRYCRAVDARDRPTYRSMLTDDARVGSEDVRFFFGRWHDDLVRTETGWRIRNLTLEVLG
ncbi:nuclear transport factor 2 family protein [Mycolicibacterium diernhoferi]|uniref:SnoaL-like domain-containing protein n=1 Tax=Mycolicibacterium diernhoferi TaxID=1801 RepID=A0A1Q4HGG7_9MYCO|nr:nuclear transport factor 2 family protein [Mycolicibacterium diernhoferi]OJZ66630.1 hypothetical protein BRW64_10330 [Mycolicibacterium diernhoferi]OPE55783.1 hypothetical protein BV510_03280 [Mycolicibacterium diernhoferi]PEG56507.1 hypothetical protein CRI78_01270 [Mycolicibacterium diernhoferi]